MDESALDAEDGCVADQSREDMLKISEPCIFYLLFCEPVARIVHLEGQFGCSFCGCHPVFPLLVLFSDLLALQGWIHKCFLEFTMIVHEKAAAESFPT